MLSYLCPFQLFERLGLGLTYNSLDPGVIHSKCRNIFSRILPAYLHCKLPSFLEPFQLTSTVTMSENYKTEAAGSHNPYGTIQE